MGTDSNPARKRKNARRKRADARATTWGGPVTVHKADGTIEIHPANNKRVDAPGRKRL